MSSLTLDLARRVAGLNFDDLTTAARDWACRAFADTVACAVAGCGDDVVRRLDGVLPASEGPSQVFGTAERLHPLDAALRNGVAAHVLDFDDCNLELDGHPSVSLVPALLALGDRLNCSGRDLLTAYVAGIEAELRIARLSNPQHAERGWHPTVTIGVLGSALAASRLLGLSAENTAIAIGIAASSAAGLRANSGTMTKALHAGMANRNGLQAALLAEAGFTANPGVLEHRLGFMEAFNGGPPAQLSSALDGWGEDFALLSPGIAIKQYPCCAFVHCAIDAAAALRAEIAGREIAAVRVVLHGKRLKNIDRPDPRSGLDAKFSTQYLTARALLAGGVGLSDFEADRIVEPEVRALAARVTLAAHDQADLSLGRVEVTLDGGESLSAEASVAMGRGPANPMSADQFRAKFDDCVGRRLPAAQGQQLYEELMELDALSSVRSLTALLAVKPNGQPASVAAFPQDAERRAERRDVGSPT